MKRSLLDHVTGLLSAKYIRQHSQVLQLSQVRQYILEHNSTLLSNTRCTNVAAVKNETKIVCTYGYATDTWLHIYSDLSRCVCYFVDSVSTLVLYQ